MKRSLSCLTLILLFAACTAVTGTNLGAESPETTPTMSVDPLVSTANIGATFSVNVTVADIVISTTPPISNGLFAWDINMTFDPTIINVTSVQKGPFLATAGPTIFPTPSINNTAGWLKAGELLSPTPWPEYGAIGTGVLATVDFQVRSGGKSLLNLVSTKLRTVISGTTYYPIDHVAEDSLFDNTGAENAPPVARFYGCALTNDTITLNASTSYDPDGWLFSCYWDFGDGTNRSGIVQHVPKNTDLILDHSYNQTGTYTVTLNVTDYYGETDKATVDVSVGPDIAITEVKAPMTVLAGESILINVTVTNEGTTTGDFNVTAYYDSSVIDTMNASAGLGASTTLTFGWNTSGVPEGTYDILANATVVEGEVDATDNIFPRDGFPPVILTVSLVPVHDIAITDVTVHPSELIAGGLVSINVTLGNEGTGPEAGFNVTVYCDSTLIQTQANISLTTMSKTLVFTWNTTGVDAGDYDIIAQASHVENETDLADNVRSFDGVVVILWHPNAAFTYSPSTPIVEEIVTFNASLSIAYGGSIEAYAWDFGDGSPVITEPDPMATYNYTISGTYDVTLTVTDGNGLTDSIAKSITIGKASSTISVNLSPTTITVGENATVSGSIDPLRENVLVTIWHRIKGEDNWSILAAIQTDENSQYSYVWSPESVATYEAKASWDGDLNTLADETTIQELTVEEAGPDLVLILIGAAVAITILIIIVAYSLKARRTV